MSLLKSKNKTFMKEFNQIFEIINFTQKILGDNYPKIIQQIFKKSYDIEKVLVSGSGSGSRSRSGSGSGSGSRSRSGSGSRTINQRGGSMAAPPRTAKRNRRRVFFLLQFLWRFIGSLAG